MNNAASSFSAKILLFGEYTILLGSSALSILYRAFSAGLRLPENDETGVSGSQVSSNQYLLTFYGYLAGLGDQFSLIIDFDRFNDDLSHGLYFHSTIPAGYGLGSSGALVAAVFERFARRLPSGEELSTVDGILRLKKIFSDMESFFHGRSSGFDPAVIFLKSALHLRPDGVPEKIKLPKNFSEDRSGIFLLDSGQAGKTAPLVGPFLERFKPGGKITGEGEELVALTNELVKSFLDYDALTFWKRMKELSIIQAEEFSSMIPGDFLSPWLEGTESGLFFLKLCGSGGGGYLAGFAPDLQKAMDYLDRKGFSAMRFTPND